jgi:AsmA family
VAPKLGRLVERRTDLSGVRGFLVLIGILAALLVAFLVAWPRLVDVPALRGELARLLGESGGSELRIDGAVRLELLPLPRVAIERAAIGDRIEVGPGTRFAADRIDVELAPLALLAGRIEPSGLQLVRPRLELAGLSGQLGGALVRALSTGPLAGVRRVDIVDGTLHLAAHDGSALPADYDAVDLIAARQGERGFRLDGSAAVAGEPLRINLSGEPLAVDAPISLTLHVEAGPRDAPAVLEYRGQLTPGSAGPSADGKLRISTEQGPLPRWLAADMALSGALEARLIASPQRVELADLVLVSAEGQLRGAGAVDLAERATFDLSLEGTGVTATPALIDVARRLLVSARSRPVLSGRADLQLASLTWRDAPVRRLRVEAGLVGGRPELRRLDATLPGQAALSWTGSAVTSEDAIAGELSLQAGELRPLLAWLGVAEASLPAGGLTSLDLVADAAIGRDRLSLRRLRVGLDASRIEGSLSYAGSPRPRLDLALVADRLNTALYRAPPPAWADWLARLEALDGTLDIAVDRLSHDILRGQGFRLRAALVGGRLDVPELRVADLAGAGLEVTGMVDLPLGAWEAAGALTMPEPKPILRLLRIEPPLEIDRLAPLRLQAESRRETGATSLDLRLTAKDATAALTGQLTGELADGALDVAVTANAPDTGELLLALGWPAPTDPPALGPLAITGQARRAAGSVEIAADAKVGESNLVVEVALGPGDARPRLSGILRAPVLDTALAAAVYETVALPLDFPAGSPWLWPGIWPKAPLGWRWLGWLDLDLALDVADLRHKGHDVGAMSASAVLTDGALALNRLRLPVAGGTLTGVATLEGKGEYVVLGTDLRLAGARAEDLAAAAAPGSTIKGRLDVDAAMLGQGRGIADLVASLSGTGELALSDALLTGVEMGPSATTDGALAAQLGQATLSGPFALTAGTLVSASPGLALRYPGGSATLDLRFDLLAWILDARLASNRVTRRYLGPPGQIRPVTAP